MAVKRKTKKKEADPIREDIDFNKLVEEATNDIHSGLLVGGGKEMKARVWLHLSSMMQRMANTNGHKMFFVNMSVTDPVAWVMGRKTK